MAWELTFGRGYRVLLLTVEVMRPLNLLSLGGSILIVASKIGYAGDRVPEEAGIHPSSPASIKFEAVPELPASYDLMTISRRVTTVVTGLDIDKHDSTTDTILSIRPSDNAPSSASIEWSGDVRAGIILRNSSSS